MSKQVLDAKCPGCGKEVSVNVDIPDAKETVRIVTQQDTARVDELTGDLADSRRTIEALRAEVQRWQSGENHLAAHDMLAMLETCPNCRPTLEAFVDGRERQAIAGLSPDEVKAIARAQKWWPPPPIELPIRVYRAKP